jgi:hypothetical protein
MKPSIAEKRICPLNGGCCVSINCMLWAKTDLDTGICLLRGALENLTGDIGD